MSMLHFKNFALSEPGFGELRQGYELVVEGDKIRELSDKPLKRAKADGVDCGGRALMPGLIDSHVPVSYTHLDVYKRQGLDHARDQRRHLRHGVGVEQENAEARPHNP